MRINTIIRDTILFGGDLWSLDSTMPSSTLLVCCGIRLNIALRKKIDMVLIMALASRLRGDTIGMVEAA